MSSRLRNVPLLLAAALLGCPDSGPSTGNVIVSGAVAPSSIGVGGTTSISLLAENVGAQPVQLAVDNGCLPNFEVLNGDGVVVGPGPRICTLAQVAPRTL